MLKAKAMIGFEAETDAEAKMLASRPLWPRELNISGSILRIGPTM